MDEDEMYLDSAEVSSRVCSATGATLHAHAHIDTRCEMYLDSAEVSGE